MRCFQTRAACSFGSVWIAICLSRNRGATMWKPVLRQHRARASCGGHVLVKVKLVLKDNAKWAYTRSGHTRNILVARICYLPTKNISPTCFSSDNRFFYLCSLHIGIRQGAAVLELGDLEAVASPRGSPQMGGQTPILLL